MIERELYSQTTLTSAEQAGQVAARYCEPDPVFWLEQAGLAGVQSFVDDEGHVINCMLEADGEVATFLDAWLLASPQAHRAVSDILNRRGDVLR